MSRDFLTCSRLNFPGLVPRSVYAAFRCGDCIGRMSDVLLMHRLGAGLFRDLSRALLMHRHGAVASGFLVCLSGILFMQLCRCDSFTPRGGGQRDRRRTLRSPSPISPTPLNLFRTTQAWFRDSAAAGLITANRVVWDNIVCAIPVQIACRHFDISFGCYVFGLESLAFQ